MIALFSLGSLISLVFSHGFTTNDVLIVLIVCSTEVALVALSVWMHIKTRP